MENFISMFQSLGFPVGMCILLIIWMRYFLNKVLTIVEDMLKKHTEERAKVFEYMQQANAEQNAIIKENTETSKKVISLLALVYKKIQDHTDK